MMNRFVIEYLLFFRVDYSELKTEVGLRVGEECGGVGVLVGGGWRRTCLRLHAFLGMVSLA